MFWASLQAARRTSRPETVVKVSSMPERWPGEGYASRQGQGQGQGWGRARG
jgi:hypothetical protein